MNTGLKILLAATALCVALCFSGCNTDNVVTDFAYTEVGGSYVVTDQFDNTLSFTPDQATQLIDMGSVAANEYLTAKFRADNPDDYVDPATVPVVKTEDIQGDIVVSGQTKGVLAAVQMVPVWGDIVSLSLNGLLGIGAIWLDSRRRKSNKVSQSLVQGVDTFRDILDQTEQGALIDRRLTEVLKDKQQELGVAKEIVELLGRYQTPTKSPIDLK